MDMKGNNSPMVLHNMQIALAQFITSQLDTKIHIKKKSHRYFICLTSLKLQIKFTRDSNVNRIPISPSIQKSPLPLTQSNKPKSFKRRDKTSRTSFHCS